MAHRKAVLFTQNLGGKQREKKVSCVSAAKHANLLLPLATLVEALRKTRLANDNNTLQPSLC